MTMFDAQEMDKLTRKVSRDLRLADALRTSGINAADSAAVQTLYAVAGQAGSHRIVSAMRAIETWLKEGGEE